MHEEIGGGSADVGAGEEGDGAVVGVGAVGDVVGVGESGDFAHLGDAADVGDVGLDDAAGAGFQEVAEVVASVKALAGGDGEVGGGDVEGEGLDCFDTKALAILAVVFGKRAHGAGGLCGIGPLETVAYW